MTWLRASAVRTLIVVVCLAVFGAATASSPCAAQGGPVPHVYLLRGIFDISEGMDVLAARLNGLGIRASAHSYTQAGVIASEAQRQYVRGAERPIILVGHSLGATAAIDVARELERAGVPVALVVTIDLVSTGVVPTNVRRAVNLYVGRQFGQKVQAVTGFHGNLSNVDFSGDPAMGHMEIQRSAAVHDRIIGLVRAAFGSRHVAGKAPPGS